MQYYKRNTTSLIQNQWGIYYHGNFQSSFHLVPLPLFTFRKTTMVFLNKKRQLKYPENSRLRRNWEKRKKNYLRKYVLYS